MSEHRLLRGVYTALLTPMLPGGAIDWPALDALVDSQLYAGVAGVVVNGTTGEAATLTANERHALLRRVVQRVKNRLFVMAGTGASSTAATIEEQQTAHALGADAALVVTPPYNRPSDAGLLAHFDAVAKASPLPVVLYNVPSRTGCDLAVPLVAQMARLPHVIGIKDANPSLQRAAQLRQRLHEHHEGAPGFALLSGDDASAAAFCAIGGDGVVSVASNTHPKRMRRLIEAALAGERSLLLAEQHRLVPYFDALSADTNPVPIKAAFAWQQHKSEHVRLPLVPLAQHARNGLEAALSALAADAPAEYQMPSANA